MWGAAIASATVNFAYEYTDSGHNIVAGGYLALLSLLGMVMFDEFCDQFEEGTAYVKRANPKFGLRWVVGHLADKHVLRRGGLHNHPPGHGYPGHRTVLNAVANLDRVRALIHAAKQTATNARHEWTLADARRHAELVAAKAWGSACVRRSR